jgi:hypothetical protein
MSRGGGEARACCCAACSATVRLKEHLVGVYRGEAGKEGKEGGGEKIIWGARATESFPANHRDQGCAHLPV